MILQGRKIVEDGWAFYEYKTTYRMGWHNLIFFVKALYPHLSNAEILISEEAGKEFKLVNITSEDQILDIPEASAIEIRGHNKIYDNAPFQFEAFNQTDIVRMFVPERYVNSLKRNETDPLTEEEKLHTFDKFMDSVELDFATMWAEYSIGRTIIDAMTQALVMKENFIEDRVYRYQKADYGVNLTKICNKIVDNWKEIESAPKKEESAPKTGGPEAVKNALEILNGKIDKETNE